jgi:uncharacterized YigZ family protein
MFQIQATVETQFEIKKSQFIGQLYPVQTRKQAQDLLKQIRTQHPNAVHVCWVLLCDGDSGLDDDGEPSGTAAKPMYNVLIHKQIFNVLAVVVRYWGGIKLGAGGLTRAYGQAISEACKLAQLKAVEIVEVNEYHVAYSNEAQVRHVCSQFQAEIIEVSYAEQTQLRIQLKAKDVSAFEQNLTSLLRGEWRKKENLG